MAAHPHLRAQVGLIASAAGLVVLAGGCIVIIGWIFDLEWLRQPLPGGLSMKANTALALALGGASLRIAATHPFSSRMLGLLVASIALLTLAEYMLGWDLGIDELLVLDDTAAIPPPGRMASMTAFCLAALGLALAVSPRRAWVTQPLTLAAMLVSSVGVVGYLYHLEALYGVASYTGMAAHTAVLTIVLGVGVLWRDPPAGVTAELRSDNLGGFAMRRLLLIAVPLPVLLGWLAMEGQRANLYGMELGTALLVVLTIAVMTSVIRSVATTVGSIDAARQESAAALAKLNETLEERVAHQTATLRNREAELRLVTEKALFAFVAIDANGRICDWNEEAERMFGWPRSRAFGLLISDVIIPERHREAHLRGLKQFLKTGNGLLMNQRVQMDALHRDGHELPVELAISAVQLNRTWRFNAFIRELKGEPPIRRS